MIGVAPGISAKAAGAAVSAAAVADRALALSLITGGIALALAYLSIRKLIRPGSEALLTRWQTRSRTPANSIASRPSVVSTRPRSPAAPAPPMKNRSPSTPRSGLSRPLTDKRHAGWSETVRDSHAARYAAVIAVMVLPKLGVGGLPELKGGDAAALVGGMGAALMILATLAAEGPRRSLDVCADHITDGFVFAFKAMGSVLPIAGFFFIGARVDLAAGVLNVPVGEAPPLLFNLIQAAQSAIPHNHILVAFGVLLVGMVTGVDGSGFAGRPLTGSLSGALGPTVGLDVTTLCAVGQIGGGVDRRRHLDRLVIADRRGRVRPGVGPRHSARPFVARAGRSVRVNHLRRAVLELEKGQAVMSDTATQIASAPTARTEIERFTNYIDGKWSESRTGAWFDDINPADTGDVVGRFPESSAADAEAAVRAASTAFAAWKKTPVSTRAKIFNCAAEHLEANVDRFAVELTREQGKPLNLSKDEILRSAQTSSSMPSRVSRSRARPSPMMIPT